MPKIEVYTSAFCPYCVAAKQFLQARELDYDEIRVDSGDGLRERMTERAGGRRTVPQIFIDGTHVGGYDDLVAASRSGRLDELLGDAR